MNREQFLAAVRARLAGLPREDIDRAIEYYREMIDDRMEDGMAEEEAVAAVGPVEEAVSKLASGLPTAPRYQTPVMPAAPAEETAPRARPAAWRIVLPVAIALSVLLLLAGWQSVSGAGIRAHTIAHDVTEPFDDIDIGVVEGNVRIAPSQDGSCRVVCRDLERVSSSVEVKNGVLTVSRQDARPWYARFGLWWLGELSVTVFLPERTYGSLSVRTVSGDAAVADGLSFSAASVTTTSGEISFHGRVERTLSIQSVSGDASLARTAADLLTVSTTSGDIWLSEIDAGALDIVTTSGEASCQAVMVSGAARFETVSGDVWFYDSDAGTLRIKTVSGDVGASLLSPKAFSVSTTSGDVRVPPSDEKAGECTVKTTSGDIDLCFALAPD